MWAVRCEIQEIEYVYWRNVSLDINQIRIEYSNAGGDKGLMTFVPFFCLWFRNITCGLAYSNYLSYFSNFGLSALQKRTMYIFDWIPFIVVMISKLVCYK